MAQRAALRCCNSGAKCALLKGNLCPFGGSFVHRKWKRGAARGALRRRQRRADQAGIWPEFTWLGHLVQPEEVYKAQHFYCAAL